LRIKTFKAPTLKEAMANVKAELGIDAIILHTTRSKKGGLLGFGSKEVVEVIAAVEDETSAKAVRASARKAPAHHEPLPADKPAASSSVKSPSSSGTYPESAPIPEQVVSPFISQRAAASQYQTAGTQFSVDTAQQRADQYDAGQSSSSGIPHNTQGPQIQSTFEDILSSLNRIKAGENKIENSDLKVGKIIKPMEKKAEQAAQPEPSYHEPLQPGPSQPEPLPHEPLQPASSQPEPSQPPINDLEAASEVSREAAARTETGAMTEEARAEAAAREEAFAKATRQVADDQETIKSLQNELDEMKEMLVRMGKAGFNEAHDISLQQALRECDIEEKIIQDIVRRLSGTEIMEPKNSSKALRSLERVLKKTVRVASGITLYSNKPKIVALVGPTGVGKTTTLAKIAAKFVLEKGINTALITADTYRISAVEQLKTYSDILGLPLEIVYSPDALKQAIEKHADKQLILIDTAGRSQYNDFQMKELIGLLKDNKDIEKHLVLSSTTKNKDAEEILSRFMSCQPDRVIFTKTDETSSLGIIMNLLYKKNIALSYLTNGQSVPDDITPASYTKLAEMLLR